MSRIDARIHFSEKISLTYKPTDITYILGDDVQNLFPVIYFECE